MELKNKVIVITGAGSGLGKELAYGFAEKGAHVVISGPTGKSLNSIAQEINGVAIAADARNEQEMTRVAEVAVTQFGRIDIWINNAGIWLPHASAEEMDMVRVREMVDVNLFGTMHGTRAALRVMKKQNSGAIINILSTSALEGRAGSSAYAASKYGAVGFTKSVRLEVNNSNIEVVVIYPGGMKTHIFDEKTPPDFERYMPPEFVAGKIIENMEKELPEEELVIRRPSHSNYPP